MLELLTSLNTNKLFWGLTMVLMQMGSRYLITDLTKIHEKLLTNDLIKQLVLFCMFFVATRDIMISIVLAVSFNIIMKTLLDEKSKFHLLPSTILNQARNISPEEYDNAKKIIDMYESTQKNLQLDTIETFKQSKQNSVDSYFQNVAYLNNVIH